MHDTDVIGLTAKEKVLQNFPKTKYSYFLEYWYTIHLSFPEGYADFYTGAPSEKEAWEKAWKHLEKLAIQALEN